MELERTMKIDWKTGMLLPNAGLRQSTKTLGQLKNMFLNENARRGMDPETVVQWERKVRSAQEGEASTGDLRAANKAPIPAVGERTPAALPPAPYVIQPSTTK